QADTALDELQGLVDDLFDHEPKLERFLASAAVAPGVKEEVLRRGLDGKVSEVLLDFLLVLNQHHRLDQLRAIVFAYRNLRDQAPHRARVWVRAAVPLSEEQIEAVKQLARTTLGLEPVVRVTIDPDALGGLLVRYQDKVLDNTVRNHLNDIRTQLLAGSNYEIQRGRDRFSHSE